MSNEQLQEAVRQMVVHCELKMENYEVLSCRSALYELGYHGEDCEQVLQFIADGGFTYCMDPEYHEGGSSVERIHPNACTWGPDQLKSRLRSLSNCRL